MKKINNGIMYAVIGCLVIFLIYITRNTMYPKEIVAVCTFLFHYITGILKIFLAPETTYEFLSAYGAVIKIIMIAIYLAIGAGLIKIFPWKMLRGTSYVYSSFASVIRYGLVYFAVSLAIGIMFLNSVVGIGAAIILFVFTAIISFIDSFFFMTAMGSYLQEIYNGNIRSMTINFAIGLLAVNICCNIYGFAAPAAFFIFPVLFTGSFFWVVQNFITKAYFDTSFAGPEKEMFDRNKIRDIITKDVK